MGQIINNYYGCCEPQAEYRLVPVLGPVREQTGPATPTPNMKRWPLLGEKIMAFSLTSSQLVSLSVVVTDKKGNPAAVQDPVWAISNSELLAIVPAADNLSATVSAIGPLGTVTVSFQADADLGAGVVPVAGLLEVEVVAGAASLITITPGTPSEQP